MPASVVCVGSCSSVIPRTPCPARSAVHHPFVVISDPAACVTRPARPAGSRPRRVALQELPLPRRRACAGSGRRHLEVLQLETDVARDPRRAPGSSGGCTPCRAFGPGRRGTRAPSAPGREAGPSLSSWPRNGPGPRCSGPTSGGTSGCSPSSPVLRRWAQRQLHPGVELAHAEWLGHVVVGTVVRARRPCGPRSRRPTGRRTGTSLQVLMRLQDLEAVQVRQAPGRAR